MPSVLSSWREKEKNVSNLYATRVSHQNKVWAITKYAMSVHEEKNKFKHDLTELLTTVGA